MVSNQEGISWQCPPQGESRHKARQGSLFPVLDTTVYGNRIWRKFLGLDRWLSSYRALAALVEGLDSIPSRHTRAYSHLRLQSQGVPHPSLGFVAPGMHMTQTR